MNDVAIIGIGQTPFRSAMRDLELGEVLFSAASQALDQAGVTRREIDGVLLGAHDLIDGRSISTMVTAAAAGGYLKDEMRVSEDGIYAVVAAYLRILSGQSSLVLVSSWSKCSEGDVDRATHLAFDPFYLAPLGFNEITLLAMQAATYRQRHNVTAEQAAGVLVKSRTNAARNELAHKREPASVADVLRSPNVCWPLHALDLPPRSDGACSLVLASADKAKALSACPVWIRGVGWSAEGQPGDRDLGRLTSLDEAARMAYKAGGIKKPLQEIDVAELHELSTYHELMEYEALGFCEPGKGSSLLEDGITALDGSLPVNPSGGVLAANAYTSSGLVRLAECVRQLTDVADGHQVAGARTALAHGATGLAGQGNCVVIVSR